MASINMAKHIQNLKEQQTRPNAIEPIFSSQLKAEISEHQFEKHRNLTIELKLIYKCLCKKRTIVSGENGMTDHDEHECTHDQWKMCRKHIISLLTRSTCSIKCCICDKFLLNQNYQAHMREIHTQEKWLMCPICGIVKK